MTQSTALAIEKSVATAQGSRIQTELLYNLPHTILENTTLNQKFNIQKDYLLAGTDRQHIKYMAIGNNGGTARPNSNNPAFLEYVHYQHKKRDCALFNHLPFVMREITNDLTPTERENYRLRRIENHNGIDYAVYYLKVLSLDEILANINYITNVDGTFNSTPFVPLLSDLFPTPEVLSNIGVNQASNDFIQVEAPISILLNNLDIAEILNACNILYGSINSAIITEWGLCAGVDKVVQGLFNGVTAPYTEVVAAQMTNFEAGFYALEFSNEALNFSITAGITEPMLNLTSTN